MKKFKTERWKIVATLLLFYDAFALNFSYFFALLTRFDGVFSSIPYQYYDAFVKYFPIHTIVCLIAFWFLKLYKSVWRYASVYELGRILEGTIISFLVQILGFFFFEKMPLSYYLIGPVILFVMLIAARFSHRFYLLLNSIANKNNKNGRKIMLIGAGSAGKLILKDIENNTNKNGRVKCIIDDDANIKGRILDNVPIVGGRDDILKNVEKYNIDTIMLAIPSIDGDNKRNILNICNETGCKILVLAKEYSSGFDDISVKNLKEVSIEDLLGRETIKADLKEVFEHINNKVILVTGAGGSIGSELCRQIAKHNPKQLIIFDIYENNAFDIQLELKEEHPSLNLVTLIGSVRDSRKLFDVFKTYKPNIVYHAAAHKHVPLMEDSPCEAIKNNTIGTYKTAYAAMINGCERFVLISTDKAVNPTNVMGASKRLCEMVIQAFDKEIKEGKADQIPQLFTHEDIKINKNKDIDYKNIKTEFVAVRFGNVLGSNGSVVPIFKKQIEKGGPVTVTHPDIVRYFMTIPEAVSLVLLAGAYAKGGEIFVLDMGSPVKIETLAKNLIIAMGHKPNVDIKIVYSGLRPGEKLYEEKLMDEEGLRKTDNDLIFIGNPITFDIDKFFIELKDLMKCAYNNKNNIIEKIADMVDTYHSENL